MVEAAAGAAWLAGEPERGLVLVETAIGGLDQARDAERVASLLRLRAALRTQLLLPGQLDDLQAALRLAARPTRVRAQVLAELVGQLWLRDRDEEARPLAEELQALAERLGDEEFRIEAQIHPAGSRRVRFDGPVPLVAEVTAAAVAELHLADGGPVWASIKAAQVDVYPTCESPRCDDGPSPYPGARGVAPTGAQATPSTTYILAVAAPSRILRASAYPSLPYIDRGLHRRELDHHRASRRRIALEDFDGAAADDVAAAPALRLAAALVLYSS